MLVVSLLGSSDQCGGLRGAPGHTDGKLVRELVRLVLESRAGRSGCWSDTGDTFLCSFGLTGLVSGCGGS